MAGAQGLAALTGGFKSGYSAVTDERRKKLIDKALNYEIAGLSEKQKAREGAYKRFGKDYASGYEFTPETWGSKLMNKFKGAFGMGQSRAINPLELQAPAPPSYNQMAGQDPGSPDGGIARNNSAFVGPPQIKHGGAVRHYADGGSVAETARAAEIAERNATAQAAHKAKIAERALSPTQVAERRAAIAASERGVAGRAVQGVKNVAGKAGRAAGKVLAPLAVGATIADTATTDTEDYRERFALPRSRGGDLDEAIAGAGDRGIVPDMDFVKDVGVRALGFASDLGNVLTMGGANKLYRDEQSAAVSAIPKDEDPEAVAANVGAQPTGGGTGQVTPGAQAPAVGANQMGMEDDPIIDFSQVRDVNPNDMPSKGKVEWEEERNFYAAQAVANGGDPLEAMKAVDAKQMRGFTMYAQQAVALLQAGDATGAANALYAAYQYFPNGVEVKFGIHRGEDGRPVLIGMGTDEETGEPIKEGKPLVITSESLSVIVENFQKPGTLRAWTTDWQKAEADAREYNEITKPEAQSLATYRAKAGDAALMNAQSRLQEALTSARGGGLKQSDFDRAFGEMNKDADTMALFETTPPEDVDYLKSVMAVAYKNNPGMFPKTSQIIKQAYREGGIAAVDEMVGGGAGQ